MCIDMYIYSGILIKITTFVFLGVHLLPLNPTPLCPACMAASDARQVVCESINRLNFCTLHIDIKPSCGLTDDNRHCIPNGCMSSFLNLFIGFPTLTHFFRAVPMKEISSFYNI